MHSIRNVSLEFSVRGLNREGLQISV